MKRCTVPAVTCPTEELFAELLAVWHAVANNVIIDKNKSLEKLPMVKLFFVSLMLVNPIFSAKIIFFLQKTLIAR
jgi:hypothetical protein